MRKSDPSTVSPRGIWLRPIPIAILVLGFFSVCFIDVSNGLFLLLSLMLYWSGCKDGDMFSPFILFLPTPISIMMYWSKISLYYLPELSLATRLWIFLGCSCFYGGLIIGQGKFKNMYLRWPRHGIGYSFPLTLILGVIPYVISTAIMGTLPILAKTNVDDLKNQFQLPVIGMFFLFLPLAILIAKEKRQFFKSVCILALLLSVVKAAKFDVMFMLFVVMYAFSGLKLNLSRSVKIKIFAGCLTVLIMIPYMFEHNYNMRAGETMEVRHDYLISSGRLLPTIPVAAFKVVQPYFYLVSPWANFDYCLHRVDTFKYGLMTLRPFISLFRIDYLIDVDYTKEVLNRAFNTHTFLTDYYYDFGYYGLILLPFVMGIVVNWIYWRSRNADELVFKAEYSVWGFAVLMMFFSNHFSAGYPLIAFCLLEAYRISKETAGRRGDA